MYIISWEVRFESDEAICFGRLLRRSLPFDGALCLAFKSITALGTELKIKNLIQHITSFIFLGYCISWN